MRITKTGESFHKFKRDSDVASFPQEFSDYIKSYGEIYYWEKGSFHVVTRAHHAREVLLSDAYTADRGAFFISRMPNMDLSLIQDFFGVVKKMMVMSDDEEHLRRRKLAAKGFEDKILEQFEVVMNRTIDSFIDEMRGKKEIEFVESISRKLPSTVLADLFCIPEKDREMFYRCSNIMTGFFGGSSQYENRDGIEVNSAAKLLKEYFESLISQRQNNPGEDYVSHVLEVKDLLGLTQDEVISQLVMMLVAGMATTTDQINNCMFLMTQHPEIQNKVRANNKLIASMLEEFKRLDPAVTFIFRLARKETKIGEQVISPGDVIFISTHAINRDASLNERPDEVSLKRKQSHFSYGFGAHFCIGAKLARMEMNALFKKLLDLDVRFQLNPKKESIRDHYSLSFSGFKELHLCLNRERG